MKSIGESIVESIEESIGESIGGSIEKSIEESIVESIVESIGGSIGGLIDGPIVEGNLMVVLISGSRNCTKPEIVRERLDGLLKEDLTIIHGAASGVDSVAHTWAVENRVNVRAYPADWVKYGKAAGSFRNQKMLCEENPDLVIAFPARASRGTRHMIDIAKYAGKIVEVIEI